MIENIKYQTLEQRSLEWFKVRYGLITGSGVFKLLKGGKTAATYKEKLIFERTNAFEYEGGFTPPACQWGIDHEDEAKTMYKLTRCVDIFEPGFVVKWPGSFGVSPDGLIGDDGLIEVKCPYNPDVHLKTLLTRKIENKYGYYTQMQAQMLATDRQWCDFVSYDPRQEDLNQLVIIRVERDEQEILKITKAIAATENEIHDTTKS